MPGPPQEFDSAGCICVSRPLRFAWARAIKAPTILDRLKKTKDKYQIGQTVSISMRWPNPPHQAIFGLQH
jgi:hypothetical protein